MKVWEEQNMTIWDTKHKTAGQRQGKELLFLWFTPFVFMKIIIVMLESEKQGFQSK